MLLEDGQFVETKMVEIEEKLYKRMPFTNARKNTIGWVQGMVPSTDGNMWWVKHVDRSMSAYLTKEIIKRKRNYES